MILQGNSLDVLKTLDSESVDCCVTSPPYYGLRAYGTNPQIWGGDKDCQHEWGISLPRRDRHPEDVKDINSKQATNVGANCELPTQNICLKCNAWRGELGLEPTPELYVQHLVEVFREVKRVLKKDGTLWLNLGDSYAGSGGAHKEHHANPGLSNSFKRNGVPHWGDIGQSENYLAPKGLKPKDLVGIPWRVAFALQADGWWLRQDIIWHKPNPMPESVTDRCTKAHEYIFLLTKSAKYYYDNEAVKEAFADERMGNPNGGGQYAKSCNYPNAHNGQQSGLARGKWNENGGITGRNRRSVWTIPTNGYKEAHFATFPEKLIEPMIKAGCPKNGTVLDPFFGAGTTGMVAKKLFRNYIGIELNGSYVKMAERRIEKECGGLF